MLNRLVVIGMLYSLILPAVPAWSAAPPSAALLLHPVIVPIEVIPSGHIAVRAKINGHGPYRFIFDTGAPTLVISEQVAFDSRILPKNFSRPFFTPLGNLGEHMVDSIALGSAVQRGLKSEIWNHPTVELLSKSFGRCEGLIGFPFFAHYQITINYKNKTMMLTPCAFKPVDTKEKMIAMLSGPGGAKVWDPATLLGICVSKSAADDQAGVLITAVSNKSPAADAGLMSGDRLLTLDGRWTDSIDDCYAALSAAPVAKGVPATLLRNRKKINALVNLVPGI